MFFLIPETLPNILKVKLLDIFRSLAWQLLYSGWNLSKKSPGEHGSGLQFKPARTKAGQDV
jgi:hypothetical protein